MRATSDHLARLAGVMLCLGVATPFGASSTITEAQARYEQERARCLSGQSGQEQATCLKEAGAALDAAKHGKLDDGHAKYRKNAKERCDALIGDEERACVARVKGDSTAATSTVTSGSVKGGGILKETVTREIGPVDAAASAASAP